MKLKLIFFGFSYMTLFFVGCASEKKEFHFSKKVQNKLFAEKYSSKDLSLSLASKKELRPIWRNDTIRLFVEKNYQISEKMVMVRYRKNSLLHSQITILREEESPQYWFQYEPEDDIMGYALVEFRDDGDLAGLAMAAHKDSYPACGALELLPQSLTTAADLPPTGPIYSEIIQFTSVKNLFAQTSLDRIKETITALESAGTRFHASTSGMTIPQTVANLWQTSAGDLSHFKVELSPVNQSGQKSAVAILPGDTDDTQTVILGAHLDSINGAGFSQPAPGADDDASGVATLREILRVIAAQKLKFKRRIEFHAYGAEEVGLLGSGTLAQSYAKTGRKVVGMMQFDMNAWSQTPGTKVYLIKNDTNDTLRKGVRDLMHTYFQGDYEEATLTAGTSDHKSWTLAGYPAVFPFENPQAYNKSLHTDKDTSQTINNLQLTERMVRLGLAFLAHYAGLISGDGTVDAEIKEAQKNLSRDLKVAVVPSDQKEGYHVIVAASNAVKSVEICRVEKKAALECVGERSVLGLSQEKGERRFFSFSTPMNLQAGQRLAFFGYNGSGKISHQRTVRLDLP